MEKRIAGHTMTSALAGSRPIDTVSLPLGDSSFSASVPDVSHTDVHTYHKRLLTRPARVLNGGADRPELHALPRVGGEVAGDVDDDVSLQ